MPRGRKPLISSPAPPPPPPRQPWLPSFRGHWGKLLVAFLLGMLAVLLISEIHTQLFVKPYKKMCPSTVEVVNMLSAIGHMEYFPRMQKHGLDRIDIIANAKFADAQAAGIKPYHWSRIASEANLILTGRRSRVDLPEVVDEAMTPTPENPVENVTAAPLPPLPMEGEEVAKPNVTDANATEASGNATSGANGTAEVKPADYVLPPPQELLSHGIPEGAYLPKDALTDTERPTVTAVCDNGLGDRLGSFYGSIWLAYLLDARLHIIWNMNNECRARFGVLFSCDATHVSVPNTEDEVTGVHKALLGHATDFDAVVTLEQHKGTAHLVENRTESTDPPSPDKEWFTFKSRAFEITMDSPLVQWAKERIKKGLRTHILHHSDRLPRGVTLQGVKEALKKYNFKVASPIIDRVNSFTSVHNINPVTTVGIHLRSTDARIPLQIKVAIADVRQRFSSRRFFVCSDSKDAEDEFAAAFPDRTIRNTMKSKYPTKKKGKEEKPWRLQGEKKANRFNIERPEDAVVDALTDMAILSRTEKPVIDGVLRDSSFGKMCTTLCVVELTCDSELAKMAEAAPNPARPGV